MEERRAAIGLVMCLCAEIGLRSGSEEPLTRYEYGQAHMGTQVRIVLYAPAHGAADDAASAAFARIAALDEALSDYRESSELMRVSRLAGTGPVAVSDDLFRVLRAADEIAGKSDGAFDVTVGPLSVLWRHARRRGELPDAAEIAAARALVGHDKLTIDEGHRTVTLTTKGMQVDLGGIAKGFAADEAAAVLGRCGIDRALVAAGGDIVVRDPPPGREGWRIAVASIDGADRPPSGFITLRNAAVSTSGDAEQFAVIGGVRRSHIIDPRTGVALTGRSSVTIVAPDGMTSDALATAVSVMGAADGMRLVETTSGAAALVVEEKNGGVRTFESRRWRALSAFTSRPVSDPQLSLSDGRVLGRTNRIH
jgi:thiamine biosynthesis lipoprotein